MDNKLIEECLNVIMKTQYTRGCLHTLQELEAEIQSNKDRPIEWVLERIESRKRMAFDSLK